MSYTIPAGCPEELIKYGKMLKFGIPEAGVRGKMLKDGVDEALFDQYLNPATAISNAAPEPEPESKKNIFDNDSDPDEATGRDDEKKEVELPGESATSASNAPNAPNASNNKSEKSRIRQINYQTSLLPNPNVYGEGSFSQTNFVPAGKSELKLETLQPVPVKKTLLIVNTFVVNTAAFLNKFVATCESKLHKIHTDITRMETTLNILEGKLNSISWLGDAESGNLRNIPTAQELKDSDFKDDNVAPPPAPAAAGGGPAPPPAPPAAPAPAEPAPPPPPAEDPVKTDPELQRWFKMLKVGVPEQAVRNKMAGSVEPDIIDRVMELHRASK